jgi:hypothetical protein
MQSPFPIPNALPPLLFPFLACTLCSADDAPDYHEAATTIQRAVRSYLGRRKFMEIFEPSETYAPIRDQRDVQATAWGDLQDRKGSLRAPDQAALRASDQGGRRSFDQRTTVRPVRTTTNDLDFLNGLINFFCTVFQ